MGQQANEAGRSAERGSVAAAASATVRRGGTARKEKTAKLRRCARKSAGRGARRRRVGVGDNTPSERSARERGGEEVEEAWRGRPGARRGMCSRDGWVMADARGDAATRTSGVGSRWGGRFSKGCSFSFSALCLLSLVFVFVICDLTFSRRPWTSWHFGRQCVRENQQRTKEKSRWL